MQEVKPRIIGTLMGDIASDPGARTKYGHFFEALGRRYTLVDIYDANLRGIARLINAALVFHPNWQYWRQRFWKNVPAFRARSRKVARYLHTMQGRADLVLQVGVMFDAAWRSAGLPNLIYTDYTARLSADKPNVGRSPFTARQREEWIALESAAYRRAAAIFTRGRFVHDSIVTDYGIPDERVQVVGGGLNFADLPALAGGAPDGPPTVLFIGKDFYRKAGDLLLRAFARTRERHPRARLLMLTDGPVPEGLPLDGVQIIEPTWDRTLIERLYRQADLFVLPSRLETWGDVLLEAMAYGLPCIGVEGEAMDQIIEDGRTGTVVPPDDADALAVAMGNLLGDMERLRQWGMAGRTRLEGEFTWDRIVDRMAPTIEAIAASSLADLKEGASPLPRSGAPPPPPTFGRKGD